MYLKSVVLILFFLFGFKNVFANESDTLHIGNSLLWKITGNGIAEPSFIYGTMHTKRNEAFHFADSVWYAMETCDAFAMEVLFDDNSTNEIMQSMLMEKDSSLAQLLPDDYYKQLDSICKSNWGVSANAINHFKPLYAVTSLWQLPKPESGEQKDFLDLFLMHNAEMMNKKIYGLETIDEQMLVFNVLSYHDQTKLLMKAIDEKRNEDSAFNSLLNSYAANNLDELMKLENDFDVPLVLYHQLIDVRNKTIAHRMDSLIQMQSTFVAVGAGHLAGENGLVNLLRNLGYTVTPVLPTYKNYLTTGGYHFVNATGRFDVWLPSVPYLVPIDSNVFVSKIDLMNYVYVDTANAITFDIKIASVSKFNNPTMDELISGPVFRILFPKTLNNKKTQSSIEQLPGGIEKISMHGKYADGSYWQLFEYTDNERKIVFRVDSRYKIESSEACKHFFNSIQIQ